LTLAEDKLEEETYSLIFTSLKHPIRRRILRMLATKPLIFSEIQEQFNIDSGHLTYHLENLGDLIAHCKDGKYRLSSIGDAAVRLMGGVEDQQIVDSSKNRRLAQVVPKVFALIVVAALIFMSLQAVNYTTIVSTASLNQDKIYPTPFTIGAGETFEFNVTLKHWRYLAPMIGNPVFSRMLSSGPFGPEAYTFEVEPEPNKLTAQAKGSVWLDVRLNTTGIFQPNSPLVLMPFGLPNGLTVDVITPNGNLPLGALEWTYGKIEHFTSTVEADQLGTYQFIIKNNDSEEWTGTIKPYVEWQITEKPYFYYGIAGLVIVAGYLVFMAYNFRSKPQK